MKQNITIEQINELSEKGKERLITWLYAHDYEDQIFNIPTCGEENCCMESVIEELSIGQMIEFLEEHNYWSIGKGVVPLSLSGNNIEKISDALWEAVKYILEEDDKE